MRGRSQPTEQSEVHRRLCREPKSGPDPDSELYQVRTLLPSVLDLHEDPGPLSTVSTPCLRPRRRNARFRYDLTFLQEKVYKLGKVFYIGLVTRV